MIYKTKVSVVMTVYNAEKYLSLSIESILNQTFTNFEFIIINDCSVDGSSQIITNYSNLDKRIKIINNKTNLGVSKSCNNAIKMAAGEYIARMDSDDIALPNRLQTQVDFLDNNSDVIAVGSNADVIDMNGNYVYTTSQPETYNEILLSLKKRATMINPTTIFRKESFLEVGGYYEPIKHYFEDFMLWAQLSKIGKIVNIKDSLLQYRIVMNSISSKQVSKKYQQLEIEISHRGYASKEELDFIRKEKAIKSEPKQAEFAYYLILAQKYILNNYNYLKATEYLNKAEKMKIFSKKLMILKLISMFPKNIIQFLYRC